MNDNKNIVDLIPKKIKSLYPPMIAPNLNGKRYAVFSSVKYIEIPEYITIEDVRSRWSPLTYHKKTEEWVIRSSSSNTYHRVNLINGKFICDCMGYKYNGNCKHIDKVKSDITKPNKNIMSFEDRYIKEQTDISLKIFDVLKKMYPEVPKFPLIFKNLRGRMGGYITTTHRRGSKKHTIHNIVIDNSGLYCFDMDYCVCHEFAHAILINKNGNKTHNKTHVNLTYMLAKKFNLA